MGAYIRTVKTLSGATAVQVVFHEYSGKKSMKHVGSARNEHELALLTAQARQIVDGGQLNLDFAFAPADTPLRGSGSVENTRNTFDRQPCPQTIETMFVAAEL